MSPVEPSLPSVLDLVGNTPILRVQRIDTGLCELYLKLECQNPGGSIKDRIALAMIEAAERDGRLKPEYTIIEATAGNTGLALAMVAAQKGYQLTLIIPDKMSQEKIFHLRAMGASVIITRSDVAKGHPEYYQDMAAHLAATTPGSFYIDQFDNPANPLAHEQSTAPELWRQMEGRLDAVVCGFGSGGTLIGLTRYFAAQAAPVEMILADPEGSVLAPYYRTGAIIEPQPSIVEGIGKDHLPHTFDPGMIASAYTIPDTESVAAARLLLEKEGLLGGSSSGTLLAAALRYCRAQTKPKRVVTFVCDTGNKYLSKLYNPVWLKEKRLHE